jgi:hypothetical protein
MNAHFGWPAYWNSSDMAAPEDLTETGNSHLRSMRAVVASSVIGAGTEIGTIADFIAEEPGWNILYAVVDTGGVSARKRYVPARLIERIDWAQSTVQLLANFDLVGESPDQPAADFPDTAFASHVESYYAHYEKLARPGEQS